MTTIFASSDASALRAELAKHQATATVEAEYGNDVVQGSVITRAHHAPEYARNPSPCTFPNGSSAELPLGAIGLSHIDLDSVGGALALVGQKPGPDTFWKLAGLVDVKGPHRLDDCFRASGATEADVKALHAYWAWSRKDGRVTLPRGEVVVDVTKDIVRHGAILAMIFEGDEILLEAGAKSAASETELNEGSFVDMVRGVIVRVSPGFTNHLYAAPGGGEVGSAVVAFNSSSGAITVSFETAPAGPIGAREIVQQLWGMDAGGHAGIAGSPRGRRMRFTEFETAVDAVVAFMDPAVCGAMVRPATLEGPAEYCEEPVSLLAYRGRFCREATACPKHAPSADDNA